MVQTIREIKQYSTKRERLLFNFFSSVAISFFLFYALFFTIIHEYLHALPLWIIGYPVLVVSPYLTITMLHTCLTFGGGGLVIPLFQQWFIDLISMMPYLFPVVLGLLLMLIGYRSRISILKITSLFLVLLGAYFWSSSGWHEYMILVLI